MGVCFVDTETTSLHPEHGEVYEVAVVTPDGEPHHWWLPVTLAHADDTALRVGRFHERHPQGNAYAPTNGEAVSNLHAFAEQFARLTHGHYLAGAVVSFDAERLGRMLRHQQVMPSWDFHLVDVEALVAGRYEVVPPWNSRELSIMAGVDPDAYDRHTALGDAMWAKALFDAVMVPQQQLAAVP